MVKKRKPYNIYTKEFKLEALRLMEESDKPSSQIALELGITSKSKQEGPSKRVKARAKKKARGSSIIFTLYFIYLPHQI